MTPPRVEVIGPVEGRVKELLTPDALAFIAELATRFEPRRRTLLQARAERQARIDAGERPDFLSDTRSVRDGDWRVAPVPPALQDRRVEITGPVDRKMVINALNSGAKMFMADFEDATSPTWLNLMDGQVNLFDAVRGTIRHENPNGKVYELKDDPATLLVRPRGWHLTEKHILVDGERVAGGLVDFGLFFYHNAKEQLARGAGPFFYLPKMQSHLEARLWNEVFTFAQDKLGVPHGSIKATVLIEHVLAAFEMDEILYELRDHAAGLNAGRWDYIFSVIKTFRNAPDFVLPDRVEVGMTTPFMRAYTELLVKTCHKRGAHAMGGMAAFVPNRRDPEATANALKKVREDKEREAGAGFDGTWVAHPDLVPVAMDVFDGVLDTKPNQVARQRPDVATTAKDLLDVSVPNARFTEQGLRTNANVGILYIESWLSGTGAAALYNLMEDAATAEISRSQVWQWVHAGAKLDDGRAVTRDLVLKTIEEELETIKKAVGAEAFAARPFQAARDVFEAVALADDFPDFLTLPAYERLN